MGTSHSCIEHASDARSQTCIQLNNNTTFRQARLSPAANIPKDFNDILLSIAVQPSIQNQIRTPLHGTPLYSKPDLKSINTALIHSSPADSYSLIILFQTRYPSSPPALPLPLPLPTTKTTKTIPLLNLNQNMPAYLPGEADLMHIKYHINVKSTWHYEINVYIFQRGLKSMNTERDHTPRSRSSYWLLK